MPRKYAKLLTRGVREVRKHAPSSSRSPAPIVWKFSCSRLPRVTRDVRVRVRVPDMTVIFANRIQKDKRSPVAVGINDSGRLPRVSRHHVTNDATKKKNGNAKEVNSSPFAFILFDPRVTAQRQLLRLFVYSFKTKQRPGCVHERQASRIPSARAMNPRGLASPSTLLREDILLFDIWMRK